MQKAKKMCLNFGKCRLPNFYVNPGFSGKLFTVEQRQKMLDLAAKNREMLMSFRAKSKDKSDTHEALETNRTVCTKHERNETEGYTKTSSQSLVTEQLLDKESKSRKEADERIGVLHTNSNSQSLVTKEWSEKELKYGEKSVEEKSKKEPTSGKENVEEEAVKESKSGNNNVEEQAAKESKSGKESVDEQSEKESKSGEDSVEEESKNKFESRKETDENNDALHTNSNSPKKGIQIRKRRME